MEEAGNKKGVIIFWVIVIAIIVIITAVFIFKNIGLKPDETLMKCIASKSHIYVSKTCSHCAVQKNILGSYVFLFNMTDCLVSPEKCSEAGITSVPTWVIDGEKYTGVKSVEELKLISGC